MKSSKPRIKRTTISKSFSFPPEMAGFIQKRAERCKSESDYVLRLIRHDQDHNTLAESFKQDAEHASV